MVRLVLDSGPAPHAQGFSALDRTCAFLLGYAPSSRGVGEGGSCPTPTPAFQGWDPPWSSGPGALPLTAAEPGECLGSEALPPRRPQPCPLSRLHLGGPSRVPVQSSLCSPARAHGGGPPSLNVPLTLHASLQRAQGKAPRLRVSPAPSVFWVRLGEESPGLGLWDLWPRKAVRLPVWGSDPGLRPALHPLGPAPSCHIKKHCPGLKKEIFINNLNNNTVDLNGHTSEAYRMVRKEAWGSAAVLGGRGGGAGGGAAARRGSGAAGGSGREGWGGRGSVQRE